jgi:hypothetical protein
MIVSRVVSLPNRFNGALQEAAICFEVERALRELLIDAAPLQTFTVTIKNTGTLIRVDVDDNTDRKELP